MSRRSCVHTGSDMRTLISGCLLSAVVLSACGPGPQQEVVIQDKSGSVIVNVGGGATPYPTDFPVPQYPGSLVQLTKNDTLTTGSGGTRTVMLASQDSADKTIPFYRQWFTDQGYKILSETSVSGIVNITGEKGNQTIMVTATASPGPNNMQTAITISRDQH